MDTGPLADLTEEEQKALAELAKARAEGSITRRDMMKIGSLVGGGALLGGGASQAIGTASAAASDSDSDGDIGAPGNRIDVFADGVDAASVNTGNINSIRHAGDESDIGAEISQAIVDRVSLYIPPSVSTSYMTLSTPIDEQPHDGFKLVHHPDAPPIDGSTLSAGTDPVKFAGAVTDTVSVSADVFEGDTAISVSDSSPFSAGDLVKLRSDDSWNPARSAYTRGELAIVETTSSGQVTLRWGVFDGYTTANNAVIRKIDAPKSVEVLGLTVTGIGGTSGDQSGLQFEKLFNLTAENTKVSDVQNTGITLRDCIFSDVTDAYVENVQNSSTGYGQHFGAATMFSQFANCKSKDCTKGFELTGEDVCRYVSFVNPIAVNCSNGIQTHAGGQFVTILNPQTIRNTSNGINIGNQDSKVIGGETAYNSTHGISTWEGGSLRLTVGNIDTHHNGWSGVNLQGVNDNYQKDVMVDGVESYNNGDHGIFAGTVFDGLTVSGGRYDNNTLRGLTLQDVRNFNIDTRARNNTDHGLYLISAVGSNEDGKVEGIYVDNGGDGIARDDAGYDWVMFDSILAHGNTGTNFNVSAQTNETLGDVMN